MKKIILLATFAFSALAFPAFANTVWPKCTNPPYDPCCIKDPNNCGLNIIVPSDLIIHPELF